MKITVTTDKGKIEVDTQVKFNFSVDIRVTAIEIIKASVSELKNIENE